MVELAGMFYEIDADHDGNIDKNELKNSMKIIQEKTEMTENQINKLFRRLDENDNGLIEYSEFITAFMTNTLNFHTENLRKAFDVLDKNNDN